ncbi:argininosuccinate lyase [Rhodopirellula maiorica SM1]|uniref:argininosuccinate lyase n=1 Tax=Rhodopirellula maiorica SM1 TaxID=1265738 RepID=M5RT91_9BACT|nr:argininosuccinate lyase [Rhodopirellula maiorica SM1]
MADSPSRSGVFQASTDKRLEAFAESISFDRRMYQQDIRGSIAHADMLASVGLLTREEFSTIRDTLKEIEAELDADQFPIRFELEDIHMHIEQALIDRIGDVGRKLHTARSRNDQVSTDVRMWVREALDTVDARLLELQRAFLSRCERDFDVVLPAYTHLQRAQPVIRPPLLDGVYRKTAARSGPRRRLSPTRQRMLAWRCGGRRNHAANRS